MRYAIRNFFLFVITVFYFQNILYAQTTGTATFTGRLTASCEILGENNSPSINVQLDTLDASSVNNNVTRAAKAFNITFKNCATPGAWMRYMLTGNTMSSGVLTNTATYNSAKNAGIILRDNNNIIFTSYGSQLNAQVDNSGTATLRMSADYGSTGGTPTAGDIKAVVTVTAYPQ